MNKPVPDNPLNHCVLLFEQRTNALPKFLEAFADRFPGADTAPRAWTVLTEPRPCAFGPLAWQRWSWHVLIDLMGMPPQVASVLEQAEMQPRTHDAVDRHRASAMVFLTGAPENASPAEQDRALARAAWALLDAGADVLIWPRTGLAWHRDELADLAPESFDPHGPAVDGTPGDE
jgi:hypothetical protein